MARLINDNNPNGPEVTILYEYSISKNIRDTEPYQQVLLLSCKHWCFNTFGDQHKEFKLGMKLNCKFCGQKND